VAQGVGPEFKTPVPQKKKKRQKERKKEKEETVCKMAFGLCYEVHMKH
jgi:hypothetical protein